MNGNFVSVIITATVTGIGVLVLCTFIGTARQYINLPVIQGVPGVFFLLALAIILVNILKNKGIGSDTPAT